MDRFDEYEVTQTIYNGDKYVIYRAVDASKEKYVYLKALRAEFPDLKDVAQLRKEYELINQIDSNEIIKTLGIVKKEHQSAMVLEEVKQGQNLSDFNKNNKFEIEDFLDVAIKISNGLMALHENKIIHKDIKPSNIIISTSSKDIKIIDFGISTQLSHETAEVSCQNLLEGSMPYISPEQTGRLNRGLDYRTDLYAIGATFYELLTQSLLFQAETVDEWARNHICKVPVSPNVICEDIPVVISNIIMKLLEKDPENRYQSVSLLRKDLLTCKKELNEKQIIENFEIARNDINDIFIVTEKIFGREKEKEKLLSAYKEISSGGRRLLMVSGYSGVGKTSLVNEVKLPIINNNGRYIFGKFDQYEQYLPYSALVNALNQIVNSLFSLSDDEFEQIKAEINERLRPNIQLIIDIVPSLEKITGKQPPVQKLSSKEEENRFQIVITNFLKIFAKKKSPLVLFLDDLHWSSSAALNMLEKILNDSSIESLLIIGAYRDNEINEGHPLSFLLRDLNKENKITNIKLEPLALEGITSIIAETLHCDIEKSTSLSKILYEKTEGNPFFTGELLRNMHREKHITFNYENVCWQWDAEGISKLPIQDNVVEFTIERLLQLSDETLDLLKIASCIGGQFDLKTLSLVANKSSMHVASNLWSSLEANIITPLSGDYELAGKLSDQKQAEGVTFTASYRFVHDRIHQAVYQLLKDADKARLQLNVGRIMRDTLDESQLGNQIIEVAGHLNKGLELLDSDEEKLELAEINLKAGSKLRRSIAYKQSYEFLKHGVALLSSKCWNNNYTLSYKLHRELVDSSFLYGKLDESQRHIDILLKNSSTNIEKAELCRTNAMQYTLKGKLNEAMETCEKGLKLLGINIKIYPSTYTMLKEVILTLYHLKRVSLDKILDLPIMTDRSKIVAMQLLMEMSGPAYTTGNQNLLGLITILQVKMSLIYGNTKESAYAYVLFGFIINAEFSFSKSGFKFGEIGVKLNEKLDDIILRCRIQFIYAAFIAPWYKDSKRVHELLRDATVSGYRSGDLVYVSYVGNLAMAIPSTNSIEERLKEGNKYLNIISNAKFKDALTIIKIFQQFKLYLLDIENEKYFQLNSASEENFYKNEIENNTMKTPHIVLNICKMKHYYMFDLYEKSYEYFLNSKKSVKDIIGQPLLEEYYFFGSLASLKLLSTHKLQNRRKVLRLVRKSYKKIKHWSKYCPGSFLAHQLLLKAELKRISGKSNRAKPLYEKALKVAQQYESLECEAIVSEAAATFYRGIGKYEEEKKCLQRAHYSYLTWGASAKVKQLENQHPEIFNEDKSL